MSGGRYIYPEEEGTNTLVRIGNTPTNHVSKAQAPEHATAAATTTKSLHHNSHLPYILGQSCLPSPLLLFKMGYFHLRRTPSNKRASIASFDASFDISLRLTNLLTPERREIECERNVFRGLDEEGMLRWIDRRREEMRGKKERMREVGREWVVRREGGSEGSWPGLERGRKVYTRGGEDQGWGETFVILD